MDKYHLLEGEAVEAGVNVLRAAVCDGLTQFDAKLMGVELSKLHHILPFSSVNAARIATFKYINAQLGAFDSVLTEIAGQALKSILGPDLLVQTKLNLSIQLPQDRSSQLDLHSDCWSGDTPFQVNLWIPLTSCFSTNSMFLLSETSSFQCINRVNKNPIIQRNELWEEVKEDDFVNLKKGQAIIFNPGLIHGNVTNHTNSTRVSINVRFKGLFSPDASAEHVSRSAGPYYRIFHLSDWTQLALKLNEANKSVHVEEGNILDF